MGELTRRTNESSGLEHERSESLPLFLQALQDRYRTELGDAEYLDWLQTLKPYKLAEVIAAANELTLNPPADWTGLPKLPDMLRVIHRARAERAEEYRRKDGESLLAEMKELQRRKDAGEEFYGLADVFKAVAKLSGKD